MPVVYEGVVPVVYEGVVPVVYVGSMSVYHLRRRRMMATDMVHYLPLPPDLDGLQCSLLPVAIGSGLGPLLLFHTFWVMLTSVTNLNTLSKIIIILQSIS